MYMKKGLSSNLATPTKKTEMIRSGSTKSL